MCLSLVKIRNNSRHYHRGYLPLYQEVPCGHCPECVNSLQRDYFLRVYYECLDIENKGGQTFFMTFTYNDNDIPLLDWSAQDIDHCNAWLRGALADLEFKNRIQSFNDLYGDVFSYLPPYIPTFNRKHISQFMKSLRQLLHQKGLYTYEQQKISSIKYYFASEYGEDFHRPHYHALLFVPFKIDKDAWLDLCSLAWSYQVNPENVVNSQDLPILEKGTSVRLDLTNKGWFNYIYTRLSNGRYILKVQRGNISYSKKNPAVVIPSKGLLYVSKYVHKTDEYTSTNDFEELKAFIRCFLSPSACKEFALPELAESVQKLKNAIPFVHLSNNLGISIIDALETKYGSDLPAHLFEQSLPVKGDVKLYKVPNYIINRIMYRHDMCDSSLRVLTEVGVKAVYYRYLDKIEQLSKSYRDTVALSWHLDNKVLDAVFKKYNNVSQADWFCFIGSSMFYDISKALAIYSLTYRNVVCENPANFVDITPLLDTSEDLFMARYALDVHTSDNAPANMYLRALQVEESRTFNFAPAFSGFELWLTIWTELNRIVRQKKIQEDFKKHQEEMKARKFHNDKNTL